METNTWHRTVDDESFELRYWLNPFPRATTDADRMWHAIGPDHRMSPILAYDYRECGWVQWVNPESDSAVLMIADGGWTTGGILHVWVALGSGREPSEFHLTDGQTLRITRGNFSGWMQEMDKAARFVEREFRLHTS